MKLLGGFWNFHVWNPKTTSLHAWLHKTEFRVRGRYMICLIWICLDLVYHLLNAYYICDIRRLCAFVFHFSDFFKFWCPFESWSNPRIDQDLKKFKTWKWKGKHVSFLVTLKWSFWEVFEISMFETQNHFSSCLTS